MKSINLLITLCIYFARMEGILSHPSSHHSRHVHLGRRQWNGFQGFGGPGMLAGSSDSSKTNDNSGGGGCSKYKIISARGTGENQGMPTVCMGLIKGILSAVSGGANYEVVYPAAMDYMNGPTQGAADAIRYLSEQHKKCPHQLYAFVGYSEGAMVITQTMNKLPILPSSVAAVSLYGNPYYKGGAPQNACSAKGGAGVATAMGVGMPEKFISRTFDCCITGDMVCQTAGSAMSHIAYPGSPSEKEAITFVSSKLKIALNDRHSSGSNDDEDGSSSSDDEDNKYNGRTSEHGSNSSEDENNGDQESHKPRHKKSKHVYNSSEDENNESTGESNKQTDEDDNGTGTSSGSGLPSWPGLNGFSGFGGSGGKKSGWGGAGSSSMPGFSGFSGMDKMPNFANGLPGMPH